MFIIVKKHRSVGFNYVIDKVNSNKMICFLLFIHLFVCLFIFTIGNINAFPREHKKLK